MNSDIVNYQQAPTSVLTLETPPKLAQVHCFGFNSSLALMPKAKTDRDKYKTELCKSWQINQSCRYGRKCQFAHGKHELIVRQTRPNYKSKKCKSFHTKGACTYGTRCKFIHETRTLADLNC